MNAHTLISTTAFEQMQAALHRVIKNSHSRRAQGLLMDRLREALATSLPVVTSPSVDALAAEIRRAGPVDAEALATALHAFLQQQGYVSVTAEMVRRADHYCPVDASAHEQWDWKARHIRQALAGRQWVDLPDILRRDSL